MTALQFQLQESLHESLVGGSSRAFTAPKTGAKGSPQREQSLARKLAINQLICSARNDGIAATMTHPVIEPASLLRYSFVQKLDPDLNAFFSEKNVGQISLDITAEVCFVTSKSFYSISLTQSLTCICTLQVSGLLSSRFQFLGHMRDAEF